MSFEPLIIQKWIFDTLVADQTLQTLLANPTAPNYQRGIYSEIAPEKDPVSQSIPQLPYVVFARSGSDVTDEFALCGSRYQTIPVYRITVWDNSNGTISYQNLYPIINRVDTLLSGQTVTVSGVTFISQRFDTDQPYEIAGDGRVDYGLTLLYRFNTIV
jgi:hypothetical protein